MPVLIIDGNTFTNKYNKKTPYSVNPSTLFAYFENKVFICFVEKNVKICYKIIVENKKIMVFFV